MFQPLERTGVWNSVVSDALGDAVARTQAGAWQWTQTNTTAYGGPPPQEGLADVSDTLEDYTRAVSWRGRTGDLGGMVYLGARYYDPRTRSFVSPDPLDYLAGPNLYSYAAGDPINLTDPDGRIAKGAVAGWSGKIVSSSPNSAAFNGAMTFVATGKELGVGLVSSTLDLGFRTINVVGTMVGATSMNNAQVAWNSGNRAAAVQWGVLSVTEAATTAFSLGSGAVFAQGSRATLGVSGTSAFPATSGLGAAKTTTGAADDAAKWIWGQNKGVAKSIRQMDQRGWTPAQVTEAIKGGQQFPATNLVNKGETGGQCAYSFIICSTPKAIQRWRRLLRLLGKTGGQCAYSFIFCWMPLAVVDRRRRWSLHRQGGKRREKKRRDEQEYAH